MENNDISKISDLDILWSKYDDIIKTENYTESVKYLKRILEISPENVDALASLASAYCATFQFKLAIQYGEKALKFEPRNFKMLYNVGHYYSHTHDYEKAIEYYKNSLDENLNNNIVLAQLAYAYNQLKEYEKAITMAERALEINSTDALTWAVLGQAHFKRNNLSKSLDSYMKSLSINPDYHESWTNIAHTYWKMKNEEQAIKAFKKALILKSDFKENWYDIGVLYLGQRNYSLAIDCFHQVIDLQWDFLRAWYMLGIAYDFLRNYPIAIACYQEAKKKEPNHKGILDSLKNSLEKNDYKDEPVDLVALIQQTKKTRKHLFEKWQNEKLEPLGREENLRKMLKRFTKISIAEMVEILKFSSIIELKSWLMELPDDISIKVDDEYVIFNQKLSDGMVDAIVSSFSSHQAYTCINCGLPIEKDTKKCPDCGIEIVYCVVCKLPISFGDDTISCPQCEAIGHDVHFSEWVKTNGNCPRCKKGLKL